MHLIVTHEGRFEQTPDGCIWTRVDGNMHFWTRYLEVFDTVRVIARVKPLAAGISNHTRADGGAVSFVPIPCYTNPFDFLKKVGEVRRIISAALIEPSAIILRAPGQVACSVADRAAKIRRPYGVEVVGDPYDVYAPGSVDHPLRPFFRWWFTNELRRQCQRAVAVSYVTREALQSRYPAGADGRRVAKLGWKRILEGADKKFITNYSSIELHSADIIDAPRRVSEVRFPVRLLTIGSLEQMYKGIDILLIAVAICIERGLDLHLTVIGEGRYRPSLEKFALKLGLDRAVRFVGRVPPGPRIYAELDKSSLFVLPSRTEGLPRALIEAMARGLPCIGTSVGGVPELLTSDCLVSPGDSAGLASKIFEIALNPSRQNRMSLENVSTARRFEYSVLRDKRVEFYNALVSLSGGA